MSELLLQHWWVGIIVSVVIIFIQEWVTRRRFAKLRQEMKVLELALEYAEQDITNVQNYLDRTPTIRTPVAIRIVQ